MSPFSRRIWALAIPLILSNLTQPLLSTVDTVLSGHLPGAAALGGVAMGGIFFNAVFWSFAFLRMGTTGLVAQAHGARDAHQLRLHFARALLMALAIGAVILLAQRPLVAVAMQLLGGSAEVQSNARIYCLIRIWSAPAALSGYAILGYLLGRQQARMALLLQAAINLINVSLALWMVIGLHRGVAGIATATMLSDWAGFLLGLLLIWHSWPQAGTGRAPWAGLLDGRSLRHLIALNRDILLRTASLVFVFAWFTRTGARLGDATLAANAVLINLHLLASYARAGFANATEALTGEAVGAHRRQDYQSVLRASTSIAFAVAALIALFYALAGTHLLALYSSNPAVLQAARNFLPWAVALPLLSVLGYQLDGVFIGATRARELRDSMMLAVASFLLLELVLGDLWGNQGLWAAFALFQLLRGLLLALRLPRVEKVLFA